MALSDEKREFFDELWDYLRLEFDRAHRDSPIDIREKLSELRPGIVQLRCELMNLHSVLEPPHFNTLNQAWQRLYIVWSHVDQILDQDMQAAVATRQSIEEFRGTRIVSYTRFLFDFAEDHFFALLDCAPSRLAPGVVPRVFVNREPHSETNVIPKNRIQQAANACNELLRLFLAEVDRDEWTVYAKPAGWKLAWGDKAKDGTPMELSQSTWSDRWNSLNKISACRRTNEARPQYSFKKSELISRNWPTEPEPAKRRKPTKST